MSISPLDLIRRGWIVVPTLEGKHPGVKSDAPGLTIEQAEQLQGDKYNVIIGSAIAPNRSGILDVETDGPVGEVNILRACGGSIPDGPYMVTPSGSIHRMFRWPQVPAGYRVQTRAGVLPKVDVMWQFFALDGENRTWHDFDLLIPDLPQGLYDILVVEKTSANVSAGEPYSGEGSGLPEAVDWVEERCEAIKGTESGNGWNRLFSTTVYGVAGLVAAGDLDGEYAKDALLDACADPYEAKAVFESAWEAGASKPWHLDLEEGSAADAGNRESAESYVDGAILTSVLELVRTGNLDSVLADEEAVRILGELKNSSRCSLYSLAINQAERIDGVTYRGITRFESAITQAYRRANGAGRTGPVGGGGGNAVAARAEAAGLDMNRPEIIWNAEDQYDVTAAQIRSAMNIYGQSEDGFTGSYYRVDTCHYAKVDDADLIYLDQDSGIRMMLAEMGHWRILNGQREMGHVPTEAAKMVTDPSWRSGLPEIKRRVEVPFMLASGEVVSEPGFYASSGVYLLPREQIIVPEVPAQVTSEDVARAKQIFDDVTEGFMFKDNASKANLIGMTLTSPLRELFSYSPMVPMLLSTAPQSGSGKGTSVRVPLSTAGVGPLTLATTNYNADEIEFEKKLVGKLLNKPTYVFLDNIRIQMSSSTLEQMLTGPAYDGRTLGKSEVNALSTMVLWVGTLQSTGSLNPDLTRRVVPVELIKNYRGTWRHRNIDEYLASKRGELIWACFVAARAWLQMGSPISNVRLDGYGGWTEVIGGILENVLGYTDPETGEPYFLGNLGLFRKTQNEKSMTIDGILERWLAEFGENAEPAYKAVEDHEDPDLLRLLGLPHNSAPRATKMKLSRILKDSEGHVINGTHVWTCLGRQTYKNEGTVVLFRCQPVPES